jgi:hypothetical protein
MTVNLTNLPAPESDTSSSEASRRFFDSYYEESLSFPAEIVDATIGFLEKRGFEKTAAQAVGLTILKQSKIDGVPVFSILETMGKLTDAQLSRVVVEILNYNRLKISTLGTKVDTSLLNQYDIRNIIV